MKRISTGRIVALLLFCFMQTILFAQVHEITGKVTDKDGNPLPGVSIAVKGTTQGTITDVDGNYTITVGDDAVLSFSFVGYVTQEEPAKGKTQINVVLNEDIMQLDEIVVTGYGVSKKSDLTGSVTSVKAVDFNQGNFSTPEQLIQGRVAGVQVVSNNGEPGAGSQVRIRGVSSIRSGVQPLYVIDGIPLDLASTSPDGISGNALGGAPSTSPLNFINADDIASIDILKDASAAAIYGSRGANGVVIITTKKGKEGVSNVNYGYKFSISNLPKKLDVLSAQDWLRWRRDSLGTPPALLNNYGHSTDWQDQIFRTAYTQEHNLSLSGGNKKTNYRTSFGYLDQQGIIKKSDLKKYSGYLTLSQKALGNRLTFDGNLMASEIIENRVPVGATGFEGDLLLNALKANPTWPVDSLGVPFQTVSPSERNPVAMLQYTSDLTRTTRLIGGLAGTLEILKGLNYKVNLGLDYSNANRFINQSQKLAYEKNTQTTGGTGQINNKELYNYLIEHTLNFSKDFGLNSLTVMAGYSFQHFKVHTSDMTGEGYATDGILYTNKIQSGTGTLNSISSSADDYKFQSFFGRINYNRNEKYLLTATVRSDGSSKFGVNNRYGTFPSFAFAWRLSQEQFIQKLGIFNNLKLRVGWGLTGNSEIPTKNSHPLYTVDNTARALIGGEQIIGIQMARTANSNITWEATQSINIGVDYGFFGGRLSGSIDRYIKTTKKLLLEVPSAPLSPTSTVFVNVDSCHIINKGTEFSLMGAILTKGDLKWNITGNMAFLYNIVKNLPVQEYKTGSAQGQGLTGAYAQIITSDQPINVFYGLKTLSIDSVGRPVYLKTASGGDSSTYLGNPQPKFTWSLGNTFTYKNFDLSIFIEGVHGNKIFNNTALLLDKTNFQQSSNALNRFVEDNVSFTAYIPMVSDRYIEDGSYVRLSNVTLGYTLKLKDTKYVKSLRLYANGSNLLVFTKYTGYDPDVSSSKDMNNINSFGIDITNYPKARTFMFGLNVSF